MSATKYYDWDRFKEMSSKQRSAITTESTFTEQREAEDKDRPPKDFGIKQMEEEVDVDWGKAVMPESAYAGPKRALEKIAAAEAKAAQLDEESDSEEVVEDKK